MIVHVKRITMIDLKLKISRSSLCDYSDTYKLVIGTMTVTALATGGGNNIYK